LRQVTENGCLIRWTSLAGLTRELEAIGRGAALRIQTIADCLERQKGEVMAVHRVDEVEDPGEARARVLGLVPGRPSVRWLRSSHSTPCLRTGSVRGSPAATRPRRPTAVWRACSGPGLERGSA